MLQFGGHHLGLNVTFIGDKGGLQLTLAKDAATATSLRRAVVKLADARWPSLRQSRRPGS